MKRLLQNWRGGSVWRHRDLRIAAPARALSFLGDEVALVALLLRAHDSGAGPWAVTALLVAAAVPTVLLAGWAGRLADTRDSRVLTFASALWQVGCCLALAWVGPLWGLLVLVVLLQAGNAVANPTWQALVPRIVGAEDTGRAVAATQSLTTLAAVAGPALAGLLVGWLGFAAPLLLDAATFAVLAVAALVVRTRRHGGASPAAPAPLTAARTGPRTALRRRLRDALPVDGLAVLRGDALLWPLMLGLFAFVVVGEVTNVVEVFLVRDALGGSATSYGLVGAATSAGIVVGSLVAGRATDEPARVRLAVGTAAVIGAMIVVAGAAPAVWVVAAAFAVLGIANGALNTTTSTLLLTRTPEEQRGRAIATVMGTSRAFSVAALALGGVAGGLLGPRVTFVVSGTLCLVVAAALARGMARVLARPQAATPQPATPQPQEEPGLRRAMLAESAVANAHQAG